MGRAAPAAAVRCWLVLRALALVESDRRRWLWGLLVVLWRSAGVPHVRVSSFAMLAGTHEHFVQPPSGAPASVPGAQCCGYCCWGRTCFPDFCPVIMAGTRRVHLSQPTHSPLLWGLLPISPSGRCMLEQPALWHTMSSIKFSRRLVRLPQLGMCGVCFALLGICDLACHTCHHGG
jgi:hypothetical protein